MRLCFFLLVSLCQGSAFRWWNPWTWARNAKSTKILDPADSDDKAGLTKTADPADDKYKTEWEATRNLLLTDPAVLNECTIEPKINSKDLTEQLCDDTFVGQSKGIVKTTSSSIVFGVLKNSQKAAVAKYTNNCLAVVFNDECRKSGCVQLLSEDELLDEFKMLNAVKELNILPKIYYLSPQVTVNAFNNDKVLTYSMLIGNNIHTRMTTACSGKARARLMVQAKVGWDMFEFTNRIIIALKVTKDTQVRLTVLKSIVQVGVQMIELLQKLHNAGFLHGDIHEGNAAFDRNIRSPAGIDWASNRVVLLDLGMARFYPDEIGLPEEQQRRVGTSAEMLSPWNIANIRVGRRDDLYRAMELVCNLMMGLSLSQYLKPKLRAVPDPTSFFATKLQAMRLHGLKKEEYYLATNKMNANLFQTDVRINKPSALSKFGLKEDQQKTIGLLLDEVVTQIRRIPSVDARPKYEDYITLMNDVIKFIDGFRTASLVISKVHPHQLIPFN